MRTTLTIDDDVAGILRQKAEERGCSFKEVVNVALRHGIMGGEQVAPGPLVRTRPHAYGFKAGVDLDRLNQVVDELEAESFVEKRTLRGT